MKSVPRTVISEWGRQIMRRLLILTAFLVLQVAHQVNAQQVLSAVGLTVDQVIGHVDRNGDGRISRGEFQRGTARFGLLDANVDGQVTSAELEARWAELLRSPRSGESAAIRDTSETKQTIEFDQSLGKNLYFVDAHSQMEERVDEERVILADTFANGRSGASTSLSASS
jgi:hypothetical protein